MKNSLRKIKQNKTGENNDHSIFPWDDVNACMENTIDGKQFINHLACPKCGEKSQNLCWIHFSSPERTWQNLCGTAGELSICTKCNIQVEYICSVMN